MYMSRWPICIMSKNYNVVRGGLVDHKNLCHHIACLVSATPG